MKFKYISISLLIFINLLNNILSSQWTKTERPALKVNFTITTVSSKGDTIFAGAYRCHAIFRSVNGGKNWIEVQNGLDSSQYSTNSVLNFGSYIFIGTNDGFYYSTNSGENWIKESNGLPDNPEVSSITTIEDKIYLCCNSGVYSLKNFGTNWNLDVNGLPRDKYNPTLMIPIFTIFTVDSLLFVGTQNGIYYKEVNETEWKQRNNGLSPIPRINCFASDGKYIVAGSDNEGIYISDNFGESWSNISNGFLKNPAGFFIPIYSIAIKDRFIYGGTEYGIYHSNNFGQSWVSINIGLPLGGASDLFVPSLQLNGNSLLAGTFKGIYKLAITDSIWEPIFTGYNVPVQFYSVGGIADNVYSIGLSGSIGGIFKSFDNGITWNLYNNSPLVFFGSFISLAKELFFIGDRVYKSTDNGEYWEDITPGQSQFAGMTSITVSDSILYGALATYELNGDIGAIYKSSDNGKSWENIGIDGFPIRSIAVINSSILAYSEGYLSPKATFRSTDDGQTWIKIDSLLPLNREIVSLESINNKFLLGTNNGIYSSTDFGITWNLTSYGLPENENNFLPVSFIYVDKSIRQLENVVFTGMENRLFLSVDEGKTWLPADDGLYDKINKLHGMGTNNSIIFVNSGDAIWRDSIKDILSITSVTKKIIPGSYILAQNFPNPFNPTTTIKYNLPMPGFVTLKIYDVLGRSVSTLVNDHKSRGEYSVEFKAKNISSGVYYYHLIIYPDKHGLERLSSVKKMLIIK